MSQRGPRGISEGRVQSQTGKSSQEWYHILDAFRKNPHTDRTTTEYLEDTYALSTWWAQAVAIRYEYARGLRATNLTVPPELARLLDTNAAAKTLFDELAPANKREYIRWVAEAAKPEARNRRAHKTIEKLLTDCA